MDVGGRVERDRSDLVVRGIRVLIERSAAIYTLLTFLPALPQIRAQLPETALWWTIIFGGTLAVSATIFVIQSVLKKSLRVASLVYATAMLGGIVTGPLAFSPAVPHSQPWMWWGVGAAVVLVGLATNGPVAVVYAILLGAVYGLLRPTPEFGGVDLITSVSEAVFAPVASLAVLALALGMLKAGESADALAERVYQRELSEAVDREVGDARTRLDRLIHDDVMTSLTALAHADDIATTRATAELARDTLTRIDDLQADTDRAGDLSMGVFLRLAADTARRVTPSVEFSDLTDPADHQLAMPISTAEAFLGPMREAVRNATRHAEAERIDVRCQLERHPGSGSEPRVLITVHDDGCGFEPAAVPAARLGIALSMRATMEAAGGTAEIDSAPGTGTTVQLSCDLPDSPAPDAQRVREEEESQLPVSFPVDQLIKICWGVVAIGVGLGLLNLDRVSPIWPALTAMPLLCLFAYVVLRRTPNLQLSHLEATAAVALVVVVAVLVCAGLPTDRWPDAAIFWFVFPTQLLLTALVFRRRTGYALAGLLLLAGVLAGWARHSIDGTAEFLNAVFGPVAFFMIAVAVARILGRIATERGRLRAQERSAIEESARRYAALVQRSLWLADLRSTARGILLEIAGLSSAAPPQLVRRALLLEARLREAVLARHVMSDELADLTDAARRRGINVVLVDSRRSPLPTEIGRTVVSEVRRALTSTTVSRLVVRLAPAGRANSASLVTDDGGDTRMITIDPAGAFTEPTGRGSRAGVPSPPRPFDRSGP